MDLGAKAILCFCAVVALFCKLGGIGWAKTALATIIGGITLYIAWELAVYLRLQQDMNASPYDGQAGLDALVFAIMIAPVFAICAVVTFFRLTRRKR